MSGSRTFLIVPLRQQGELVGNAERTSHRRCTPSPRRRSSSSRPFADQAVIAIENVRLFNELDATPRRYEALEQQTATSEILGVIARSPTVFEPVLEVVAESAGGCVRAHDALIFRSKVDESDTFSFI